jgi:hypothetical protein
VLRAIFSANIMMVLPITGHSDREHCSSSQSTDRLICAKVWFEHIVFKCSKHTLASAFTLVRDVINDTVHKAHASEVDYVALAACYAPLHLNICRFQARGDVSPKYRFKLDKSFFTITFEVFWTACIWLYFSMMISYIGKCVIRTFYDIRDYCEFEMISLSISPTWFSVGISLTFFTTLAVREFFVISSWKLTQKYFRLENGRGDKMWHHQSVSNI